MNPVTDIQGDSVVDIPESSEAPVSHSNQATSELLENNKIDEQPPMYELTPASKEDIELLNKLEK